MSFITTSVDPPKPSPVVFSLGLAPWCSSVAIIDHVRAEVGLSFRIHFLCHVPFDFGIGPSYASISFSDRLRSRPDCLKTRLVKVPRWLCYGNLTASWSSCADTMVHIDLLFFNRHLIFPLYHDCLQIALRKTRGSQNDENLR